MSVIYIKNVGSYGTFIEHIEKTRERAFPGEMIHTKEANSRNTKKNNQLTNQTNEI